MTGAYWDETGPVDTEEELGARLVRQQTAGWLEPWASVLLF